MQKVVAQLGQHACLTYMQLATTLGRLRSRDGVCVVFSVPNKLLGMVPQLARRNDEEYLGRSNSRTFTTNRKLRFVKCSCNVVYETTLLLHAENFT